MLKIAMTDGFYTREDKDLRGLIPPAKDAMGAMLTRYLQGDASACARVESSTLEMSEMEGATLFRTLADMEIQEREALDLCRGRVLDAGAGAGSHSLELQARSMDVTAVDISPGCVAVMRARGVEKVVHQSLFALEAGGWDTLLMLMNGIGLCGSIEGLNFFFQHVRDLLAPGGQILADSTDLSSMYTSLPIQGDPYYGETQFRITFEDIEGEPFDWLYIDYATLAFYAEFHGFRCERAARGENGAYLARIY